MDSRLLAVLAKYVPPIIAKSIVERARREATSGPDVSWTDPNGLLDRISVGVRLFAAAEHQSAILREITDLAVEDAEELPPPSRPLDDLAPSSTPSVSSRPRIDEPISSGRAREEPLTGRSRVDEPVASRPRIDEPAASRPRSDEPAASRPRSDEPAASRPRIDEPTSRPRIDEPISRRDTPPAPPSSPTAVPSSPATTQSSPGPLSSATPMSPSSSRRDPPATTKRDTDITGFNTWRTHDTPAPSRGVYPTSVPRTATSGTLRMPALRPSPPPLIPAIPPPPAAMRPLAPDASQGGQIERSENREVTVTLLTEHDIPRARQVAREICEALGTRALTQQRLVTIVSELGRNMVLYAGGGRITLRPPINAARRVVVLAVDQGPGIANLSEIMAGKYKSRSGLGLGIVGTKRLADSFHIETGRHGTAISVEVIV